MVNEMIEGLQKTLAQMREREEMCRDVALSIQRLLDAEGALYAKLCEPCFVPMAASTTKAPTVKATKAKVPTSALAPRTCEVCGKEYQPTRKDQRNCSKACGKAGKNLLKEPAAQMVRPPVAGSMGPAVDRLAAIRAVARRMDGLSED